MNSTIEANFLKHSDEGISVSSRFYDKKVMVYVEGPDDISFWDAMFQRVVPESFYEIESVQGKNQLFEYIHKIEKGLITNAFVATDLDYSLFPLDGRSSSAFVIYTYGHSIENTMFCPRNVSAFIRKALHSTKDYSSQVNGWYQLICERIQPLLPYDIINSIDIDCKHHISNGLNSFFGKRFYFYQDKSDLVNLDSNLIKKETLSHPDFDKTEIERIQKSISSSDSRETRHLIQGHFLADAVMNFIRVTLKGSGQKISISDDAFYMAFFDCYAKCPSLCHDKMHVYNYIKRAVDTYVSRNSQV